MLMVQYQEEAWAEQLSTLEAMGFPRETALKALYQVGGRLEPALGQLMGMSGVPFFCRAKRGSLWVFLLEDVYLRW